MPWCPPGAVDLAGFVFQLGSQQQLATLRACIDALAP
jgi:hypothetical protein